jgi:hypothetical protein
MTRCGQISKLFAKHIGEMEDDALCCNDTVSRHVLFASGNFVAFELKTNKLRCTAVLYLLSLLIVRCYKTLRARGLRAC